MLCIMPSTIPPSPVGPRSQPRYLAISPPNLSPRRPLPCGADLLASTSIRPLLFSPPPTFLPVNRNSLEFVQLASAILKATGRIDILNVFTRYHRRHNLSFHR